MAGGTIYGSTGNQYIDAKIVWSYTQNASANTSTVTAALYYKRNNSGYTTYGTGEFTIYIAGQRKAVKKTLSITNDEWVEAVNHTVTIEHGNDGRKTIDIYGYGSIPGTTLSSTTCGQSVHLANIPKYSTIGLDSQKNLGETCWVWWTPQSSSFSYELKFELGDWRHSTGRICPNTTKVYEYGYELPYDVAEQLPNDTRGTMTVTLYTYPDSTTTISAGASSKSFTVIVPSDFATNPTVNTIIEPVSSLGDTFSSLYIQGKSKMKVTFSSEAKYGASIKSYSVNVNGKTYPSSESSVWESPYLESSGEVTVRGGVTDSRGYYSEIDNQIKVIPYSKPKLLPISGESAVICARCDKYGNLSESGTSLYIKVARSYSKVEVDGEQKNFCRLRYQYKLESAEGFSGWYTLYTDSDEYSGNPDEAVLLESSSYIVRVGVIDDIGETAHLDFAIPTSEVTFHLKDGGMGAAFGKYSEDGKVLDIADDWDVWGRVYGLGRGKFDIPREADLNTYTNFGVYNILTHDDASTITNLPVSMAGRLIVSSANGSGESSGKWVYVLQEYISIDGSYHFSRLMHTDEEGAWTGDKWWCKSSSDWVDCGLSTSVTESTITDPAEVGRRPHSCAYRVENENHVYIAFNCQFAYTGSEIQVNSKPIPDAYRPKTRVYAMCATGGRNIARVRIDPSGNIYVDWIQALATAEQTTSTTVYWIDGYIDYWI